MGWVFTLCCLFELFGVGLFVVLTWLVVIDLGVGFAGLDLRVGF